MIPAAFMLLGAVWRFVDGLSGETSGIPTSVRNVVTIGLCLGSAWWSLGSEWAAMWTGGCAALSIIIGCTKWEDWTWQAIRFGGMAAIAVVPLGLGWWCLVYIAPCALAGMSYPALGRVDRYLPRWWLFDGWEAYARLLLGAAIVGGLAGLSAPQ